MFYDESVSLILGIQVRHKIFFGYSRHEFDIFEEKKWLKINLNNLHAKFQPNWLKNEAVTVKNCRPDPKRIVLHQITQKIGQGPINKWEKWSSSIDSS